METEKKVIDEKVLPIPMLGKEIDRIEGETFYLALHEYGILYHVYNNMDLIIRQNSTAAYAFLSDLITEKHFYLDVDGEGKDLFESILFQTSILLSIPRIVFSDIDLYNILSEKMFEFLKNQTEKLDAPLQEETPKENMEFEKATIALETLKESVKEG